MMIMIIITCAKVPDSGFEFTRTYDTFCLLFVTDANVFNHNRNNAASEPHISTSQFHLLNHDYNTITFTSPHINKHAAVCQNHVSQKVQNTCLLQHNCYLKCRCNQSLVLYQIHVYFRYYD